MEQFFRKNMDDGEPGREYTTHEPEVLTLLLAVLFIETD
jgi:hypothetical protein